MYLIKTARDMIYDLENGRVYLNHGNSIAMFDSPVSVGVLIAEDSYDECDRTWNHMSILCKHDATTDPQPAPVETPVFEGRFPVGTEVRVVTIVSFTDEQYVMKSGKVISPPKPTRSYPTVVVRMDEGGEIEFFEYQLAAIKRKTQPAD